MNSGDRFKAVLVIWVAVIVVIAVFADGMTKAATPFAAGSSVIAGAVCFFVALFASVLTWRLTRSEPDQSSLAADARERRQREAFDARERGRSEGGGSSKAKRSDLALVERLLDTMSDTERAALRRRLMGDPLAADQDEEVSLEDLDTGYGSARRSREQ